MTRFSVGDKVSEGGIEPGLVVGTGVARSGEWVALDYTDGEYFPVIRDAKNCTRVEPFFEEGKTYRHPAGPYTFKVRAVVGEGAGRVAFGFHAREHDGSPVDGWTTRDTINFKYWTEA